MMCESCERHRATVEAVFADGATFVVCTGCAPTTGVVDLVALTTPAETYIPGDWRARARARVRQVDLTRRVQVTA